MRLCVFSVEQSQQPSDAMAQPSESLFQGGGLFLPSAVEDYQPGDELLACDTFMPADFSVPDALSAASE